MMRLEGLGFRVLGFRVQGGLRVCRSAGQLSVFKHCHKTPRSDRRPHRIEGWVLTTKKYKHSS